MEQLLEAKPVEANGSSRTSIWKNPASWLLEKNLSRSFWVFFAVAFFFDFGFSIYVFLFNLYLLDFHFNELAIGLVGGAATLGSVIGTLPAGWIARKTGLRPLLAICLIASPLLGVARTLAMWQSAQIGLAFLSGLGLCSLGSLFPAGLGEAYHGGESSIGFQPHFLGRHRHHRARRSGLRLFAPVADDGRVCDAGRGGEAAHSNGLVRYCRGRTDSLAAPAASATGK